jgi:ketosteroid isomerase-like protein
MRLGDTSLAEGVQLQGPRAQIQEDVLNHTAVYPEINEVKVRVGLFRRNRFLNRVKVLEIDYDEEPRSPLSSTFFLRAPEWKLRRIKAEYGLWTKSLAGKPSLPGSRPMRTSARATDRNTFSVDPHGIVSIAGGDWTVDEPVPIFNAEQKGVPRMPTYRKNPEAVSTLTQETNDIDELTALNRDFVASVQNSDVRRFDEILAPEFYCSNPDKLLVDRAAFLEQTAKPVAIKNLQAHDVKIRIMSDFAIIHAATSYTMPDGQQAHGRYTDCWAKQNGKWLAVSAHVTR